MYFFIKRIFDVMLSLSLLLLLSPIFLLTIVILYLFNDKDVFYVQKRIGYKNEIFGIIKFSSMLRNSVELPGGTVTLRDDPRVTKIGRILRITKLNELPQLINILVGHMSFIGPRPQVQHGFNLYPEEMRRFVYLSRPGITGISSLVFRDEEKLVSESKIEPEKFYKDHINPSKHLLEKWYFKNKSILVDLTILFLTAIKVFIPSSNIEFKIFRNLPKIQI